MDELRYMPHGSRMGTPSWFTGKDMAAHLREQVREFEHRAFDPNHVFGQFVSARGSVVVTLNFANRDRMFRVYDPRDGHGLEAATVSQVIAAAKKLLAMGRGKNPAPLTSRVVSVYATQSGKEGLRITKHVTNDGRVFYSYIGAWGAGSVDPTEMARIVERFRKTKRGMRLIAGAEFGRETNPVPPSSRQGQTRPARSHIDAAANLYERFTGNEPHTNARLVDEPERNAFLRVGTVAGILYNTNRDGRMEKYIHHFHPKSAPELLVSHDGKVARTLGGRFTFTDRGFVDEDAAGNEIE